VIPNSDGAGTVDAVGKGVSPEWIGRRVWCFGAQSYRPFGTAAEYTVVPLQQLVPLPESVPFEQGACLGIPGITAHRCVHVGGPVGCRTVLVQGGGAVGACAVHLAHRAGARVIATCRSEVDQKIASRSGADAVVSMEFVMTALVAALAIFAAAATAVEHSGTWKLNPAKSKYSPGSALKNLTETIAQTRTATRLRPTERTEMGSRCI
jgi:NADPH:quinone reductase